MAADTMPPAGERADFAVASDAFEGAFPSNVWTVSDGDPAFGADQWSTTSYRANAGARSAWAAGAGNRTSNITAFTEDFETGGSAWSADDNDANYGDDYWGLSDAMAYSGTYSFWCAQNGFQEEWGDYNVNVGLYDNYMDTRLTRPVDLTGYSSATIDFYYWMDIETGWDYFYVAYYANGWNYINQQDGNSGGWVHETVNIPVTATAVGFAFTSDTNTYYSGVYVDDPQVYGVARVLNTVSHLYDEGMNTTMTRAVDFSGYTWAHVDYSYWLDTDSPSDYLEVTYFTDAWYSLDRHGGSSGGWLSGSVEVPAAATRAGFRFVTDSTGRAEGAYIDDARFVGAVGLLRCSVGASPDTGIEGVTPFLFSPLIGGGLVPFAWSWTFGDTATSTAGSPTHTFEEAGTYTATVTVTDRLGQSCTSSSPSVAVDHDVSVIGIDPPHAVVTEGGSVLFSAYDVKGHTLDFSLAVDPASCGEATMDGGAVMFASSTDGGGMLCTLSVGYGGAVGTATVDVLHDVSSLSVSSASLTVVESHGVNVSAFDANGHPLSVGWTATCGRVDPGSGPSTVFTASTAGGNVCRVAAQGEVASAGVDITVLHDVSELSISPSHGLLVEGQSISLSIVDHFGHSISAAWSVAPETCGAVTPASGPATTFASGLEAGGLSCTVTGSVSGVAKSATVNVSHDWSSGSIEPLSGAVEEGKTLEFTVADANGQAVSVPWALSPAACGSLSPQEGPSTTFSAAVGAAGIQCTIQAQAGQLTLRASALVLHAPAATLEIAVGDLEAGRATTATATVKDVHGHALPGADVHWTTDCAEVSPEIGAQVSVVAKTDAPGATCHATAAIGGLTKTVEMRVLYARPFSITITPAAPTAGGGSAQQVTATVTDAVGNPMDAGGVTWTSSCGAVAGTGATVTFTAPSAGGTCTISASVGIDGAQGTGSVPVTVQASSSSGMLIGVAAAVAAAAALGFVLMRRRGANKEP